MKSNTDPIISYLLEKHRCSLSEIASWLCVSYWVIHNIYKKRTPMPFWLFASIVRDFDLKDETIGALIRISFDDETIKNYTDKYASN